MVKRWIVLGVSVIALVVVLTTASAEAEPALKPYSEETVVWQLSQAQVLDPGKRADIPEGTLITGYRVQATAKAKAGALIPDGKFELTASVFSPKKDMPGQLAGRWYLKAEWKITDSKADPRNLVQKSRAVRHPLGVVEGQMLAQSDSNPLESKEGLVASVRLPMAPASGRWAVGDGTFFGNAQFEGQIRLDAKRWPELKKGTGR